jgi:hypothetical protein
MNLDLDSYIETLFPWDFSVTVRGVSYPTRPLTIGDLLAIENIQAAARLPDAGGDAALKMIRDLRDRVVSFFPGEKPDVDAWQPATLTAVIGQITRYWSEFAKKNAAGRHPAAAATEKPVPPKS